MAEIWRGAPLEAYGVGEWRTWSRGYATGPDGACLTGEAIGRFLISRRDRLANILPDLNGCFSAFLTNGGRAVVVTDRFGTVPIYLGPDRAGGTAVSDCPWSVICRLAQAPRISPAALVDMLHAGYVPGTGTLIADVETAAPAAITEIEGRTIRVQRYWTYGYEPAEMTEAEAVEGLEEALRSVTRRSRLVLERIGARPLLTLSGGLDSRLLAGLFAGYGEPAPAAVSYGTDHDPEVAVAKEIAAALHMQVRSAPVEKSYLNDAFFARSAGEVGCTTRLTCGIGARHITAASDEVLVPGHTGDFISGGHLPPQTALVHNRAQLQRFLDLRHFRYPFSQRLLRRILGIDPVQRFDGLARTTSDFDMAEDIFGLIDRWNVENRQRRLILMELRAYEQKAPWILPLYDYELVDFFARIPHALRFGQYLYVKTALERIFTADAAALATIQRVGKPLTPDRSADGRMGTVARVPEVLATPALALLPAIRALKSQMRGVRFATSGPDPLCHWYHTDQRAREFLDARIRAITLAEVDSSSLLKLATRRDVPQEFFQRVVISAITAQEILNQAQGTWMRAMADSR